MLQDSADAAPPAKTSLRTEFSAALAAFGATLYIVFLIPNVHAEAGQNIQQQIELTILLCAVGTLLFSLLARLPYVTGPGIVPASLFLAFYIDRDIPWDDVLGIGVITGALFSLLAMTGVLTRFAKNTPRTLKIAVKFSIGLYLMAVAASLGGIAVENGRFFALSFTGTSALFLIGLVTTFVMSEIKALKQTALLGGIAVTTVGALVFGFVETPTSVFNVPSLEIGFAADVTSAFQASYIDEVLTLLYLLIADIVATFETVPEASNKELFERDGSPKNLDASLKASGLLAILGPAVGSCSSIVFFESMSSVIAGGRRWVCGAFTGTLFLALLFFVPLATVVPSYASAVALGYVGYSIAKHPFRDLGRDRITRYVLCASVLGVLLYGSIAIALFAAFVVYPVALQVKGNPEQRPSFAGWIAAAISIALLVHEGLH